jgi:aldose 1-epimerase
VQYLLRHGSAEVVIAEVGATLRSYRDGEVDVIQSFPLSDYAPSGSGQVLAPWPNRIAEGKYSFDGRAIKVPIDDRENNSANHGLVRWRPWSVVAAAQNRVALELTLLATPAYPFSIMLEIEYHLSRHGLTVTSSATNVGDGVCPFGIGFHPYFAVGVTVDDMELQVPARTYLELDKKLIPTGTDLAVEGSSVDFRLSRPIGTAKLNTTFTDLDAFVDGRTVVTLHDRWRGRSTEVWMDEQFTCVQVFTGDTIASDDRRRKSVAVEPMTCPPNALNTGTGLIVLEPGQSWSGQWGITPTGGM